MRRIDFLALAVCALGPVPGLQGQSSCPEGRISEIVVENHSIFDPELIPAESRLLWAYRMANAVHIPTREDFITGELSFAEGDCLDSSELRESARILREFRFIARAELLEEPASGGDRRIIVQTRDEWTTKVALNVRIEGGLRFEGISLFEENFLGRGATVGVFRVDRDETRDVGAALEIPSLGSWGFDALMQANRTRAGGAVQQALVRPFHGERTGDAFLQRIFHRRDLFAYVTPDAGDLTHVVVPLLTRRVELSVARRVGSPGRLTVIGAGLSHERVSIGGPEEVEAVRGGDFSEREPAAPALTQPLIGQMDSRQATRVNVLLGLRRLRFVPRSGLDALDGVQDVPVGRELLLTLGRSVGETGEARPGDLFSRVGVRAGRLGTLAVAQLHFAAEGRLEDPYAGSDGHWRDLLSETHVSLYFTPSAPPSQTVVLRAAVHAGWRTTSPYQITLGGPDGVRGYGEAELPGARRAVASVESRIRASSPFPTLFDIGITLFGDVGAVWKGDAPFGVDSGARGTLGAGLRIGFPAGTSSVIRADVAFPIGPGASSRGPIVRVSAVERIGVLGRFLSPQLNRSRRSGIQGEYIGVARDGSAW